MKQLKHIFAAIIIPFIQPNVNAATIQEIGNYNANTKIT